VFTGCRVSCPHIAKAVNFQVLRTIPSAPLSSGSELTSEFVAASKRRRALPPVSYEDIGGLEREVRECGSRRVAAEVLAPFERLEFLAPRRAFVRSSGHGRRCLPRAVARDPRAFHSH